MTDHLTTALRDLAESEPPHGLDAERIMHEGRRGEARRRMAALGGGLAVLAATGLAVGVLAPTGSAGHPGPGDPGGNKVTRTSAPPVNPHDPIATHWQFGYLPDGMTVQGGAGTPTAEESSVWAYDGSGFRLLVTSLTGEPDFRPKTTGGKGAQGKTEPSGDHGLPAWTVPAEVSGASSAYWQASEEGGIVQHNDQDGDTAQLTWQRHGQWLQINVTHAEKRADWQEQALKAAGGVVRQDRSAPLPIRIADAPKDFGLMNGYVTGAGDHTFGRLTYTAGPADTNPPDIMIFFFRTGTMKIGDMVPPENKNTCKESNGLTVCVSSPTPERSSLAGIGGAKKLLGTITSLGPEIANWTTDVLQ